MYCVMRASVPSLYNVYRRYDIGALYFIYCIITSVDGMAQMPASRDTFSKPPNSRSSKPFNVAGYTPGPLL